MSGGQQAPADPGAPADSGVVSEDQVEHQWQRSAQNGDGIERFIAGFVFRDDDGLVMSLDALTPSSGCTCEGFLVRSDWDSWQEVNEGFDMRFDPRDAGPRLKLQVESWCIEYREEERALIWFETDHAQYCLVEGEGAPDLEPEMAMKHADMREKVSRARCVMDMVVLL